ncbi:PHP domain-containing protein [Utexia brackfieldae]|uniref:RNase RNM n=1 Tax=Utexia brackfieldae TaxID=3074108 RepID=UPI00370DB27C
MLQNPQCYDLHSHTTASDGLLSPTQLVQRAVANGVDVLAITDHDSINGIEEARAAISHFQLPLTLINGVEISTNWRNYDIHIVGLNIDTTHDGLTNFLNNQAQLRVQRAIEISDKLAKIGIANVYEHALQYAQGDIVSRAHLARYLVDIGLVKDIGKAFKQYLGKGKKAYIAPGWQSIEAAIAIIHAAGGQAVLAHPARYDMTNTKLKKLLTEFKLAGGDAIEVSQSRQSADEFYMLAKYAIEYGFLASRGSDFHAIEGYLDLGRTMPLSENVMPIWHNWS